MKKIPYGRQFIDEDDIQAVVDVLKSDFLTCGPFVERFENAIAEYTGAKYAVAVANATAGLHLACLALELSDGDSLWTSPNTFVASANCGLYCGANIDFVDIDPKSYNISITELEKKLLVTKETGKLPKIVVAVHFAGAPCEMKEIHRLAMKYKFHVIEDASHAIGAKLNANKVGNSEYSDFTIFSFHPVKVMTSGEGGIVLTNNKALYEKLKLLRSHGIVRSNELTNKPGCGPWYYEMVDLGFNYRITDLQCALGWSQLKKVDHFISRRHTLANRYDKYLHDLPLTLPYRNPNDYSALHLYPIQIESNRHNKDRRQVFQELYERGIGVNVHYIPVHTQPYYQKLGFTKNDFPNAVNYYNKAITLPLYYGLTEQEQDYIIECLYEILQ